MKDLKVYIFAGENRTFQIRKSSAEFSEFRGLNVLWADSSVKSREYYINENIGEWLFFIDHDCHLDLSTLAVVKEIIVTAEISENLIFTGQYTDPSTPALLQRAHNFIANSWLEHAYIEGNGALLGGVFLIRSNVKIDEPFEIFWGAEDKGLALKLKGLNFKFSHRKELRVIHHTSKSFGHFFRRAWLHGKNEIYLLPQTSNQSSGGINCRFWIRKVDFADLLIMPLIALHFFVQRAGLLFQKCRPRNK